MTTENENPSNTELTSGNPEENHQNTNTDNSGNPNTTNDEQQTQQSSSESNEKESANNEQSNSGTQPVTPVNGERYLKRMEAARIAEERKKAGISAAENPAESEKPKDGPVNGNRYRKPR